MHAKPKATFAQDAKAGTLPNVSWVYAPGGQDFHPGPRTKMSASDVWLGQALTTLGQGPDHLKTQSAAGREVEVGKLSASGHAASLVAGPALPILGLDASQFGTRRRARERPGQGNRRLDSG